MRILPRGLNGMKEVPVLKELNDLRQIWSEQSQASGRSFAPDFSVLDKDTFMTVVPGMLGENRYTPEQVNDAYLQLHLISELGGSHAPIATLKEAELKNKGINTGKYDLEYTYVPKTSEQGIIDDTRSREHTAQAFLEGWKLRPTITNAAHLQDTSDTLDRFITTGSKDLIANTGFRTKKKRGSDEHQRAVVQNFNDASGGYDRLTRDYIVNQKREFGHDIAVEMGGPDTSDNGRMQAKGANRAAGKYVGEEGAKRMFGLKYKDNMKRMSGELLARYNDYLYDDLTDVLRQ